MKQTYNAQSYNDRLRDVCTDKDGKLDMNLYGERLRLISEQRKDNLPKFPLK